MEQIYTIPVNEAFEASAEDPACGCPLCAIYRKLEENELELILGASMMEPDVRIKTNEQGFCRLHYDLMFVRKNRLGMALTLESHLKKLQDEIKEGTFGTPGSKPLKRITELESTCYVCKRAKFHFEHMAETVVFLWDDDEDFGPKLRAQPYFCLPHYKRMLSYAQARLPKRDLKSFVSQCEEIQNAYIEELNEDVSWFCKKFDYRYNDEPWYNSKDSVERSMKFLRSDIHKQGK